MSKQSYAARADVEYTIYAIQCVENHRLYIGCTSADIQTRVKAHYHELKNGGKFYYVDGVQTKTNWQDDFDNFGIESFKVYVIEKVVGAIPAHDRESDYILHYCTTDPRYGYNRNAGRTFRQDFDVEYGLPDNPRVIMLSKQDSA